MDKNELKYISEMGKMFPNYPCANCVNKGRNVCGGVACLQWRQWFKIEWRKIRRGLKG